MLQFQKATAPVADEPRLVASLVAEALKRPELRVRGGDAVLLVETQAVNSLLQFSLYSTATLDSHLPSPGQDDLYMLLLKQTRGCPDEKQLVRGWELFAVVCSTFPCSRDLQPLVSEFLHAASREAGEAGAHAKRCFDAFKRVTKVGARQLTPSDEDIASLRTGTPLSAIVFFLDDTFEELQYGAGLTVGEAGEALAKVVGLHNCAATFGLFEHRTLEAGGEDGDNGGDAYDVVLPLDDSRYVADVLADFHALKEAHKEVTTVRLLFRKRLFRDVDDGIAEPAFVTLCCTQALHDYQHNLYPVPPEEAVSLAALAAHIGGIGAADVDVCLELLVPHLLLPTRPRSQWTLDITQKLSAMSASNATKDDSRAAVLRIMKTLPYGLSAFFPVTRVEDPVGLLPGKVLIGINQKGIHFFRPKPREYLHCAELRDIMQFGSSATAVFFKMRVAGALHVFQFETPAGEEICLALQTHINDIMARRYQRQQARLSGSGVAGAPQRGGTPSGRPLTPGTAALATSPHAATPGSDGDAARRLADISAALADAHRRLAEETAAKAAAQAELEATKAALAKAGASAPGSRDSGGSASSGDGAAKRVAAAPTTAAARPRVGSSTAPPASPAAARKASSVSPTRVPLSRPAPPASPVKTGSSAPSKDAAAAPALSAASAQQLKELQQQVAETQEKLGAAERAAQDAGSERDALAAQLASLELSGGGPSAAVTQELGDLRAQLAARDASVAQLLAEVGTLSSALAAKTEECAELEGQLGELDDLREQLAEVAHKDEQTGAIIKRQRTALEALEVKYRDEAALRRKYYNQLEEAKGKVRVFARVRPLGSKEKAEKQACVVTFPDEYTLEHPWKDGNRSYTFDAVFGPEAGQEEVFEQVSYLVQSALDGYNVVVFAYGQTGSGKTFTISGTEQDPGVTPRALRELTRLVDAASSRASVSLRASMLELYCDNLQDLLLRDPPGGNKAQPRLDIKKDAKGWVTVTNLTQRECGGYDDLMAVVQEGTARRRVANTQMNTESSRSHQVFSVVVESTDTQTQTVTKGKLSFVDLAGSERVKKSGAAGEQLKEAQAINLSLSALGNVISALATEQGHIPYRDHKLTMLLSDCLGGSAKTLMFVNTSPTDGNVDETQSSLAYAQRVRLIKNDVTRNVATKEIEMLRKQLAAWRAKAGGTEADDLLEVADVRQAPAAP